MNKKILLLYFIRFLSKCFIFFNEGKFQKKSIVLHQALLVAPIITGSLAGQLGNQMFIVATTLAHAWDHKGSATFPDFNDNSSFAKEYSFAFHRDELFFRLNTKEPSPPFTHIYNQPFPFCSDKIPFKDRQRLVGSFQVLKFFHHHRNKILDLFAPSEKITNYLKEKYGPLLDKKNTVSIHVRTYDEYCHASRTCFLGIPYYKKAIDCFPKESIFVVFSDRINWCKVHFQPLNRHFVFIEGNNQIEDLFLMSMMKSHIISNSTYGWWGAYLDRKEKPKIIYPAYWNHPRVGQIHPHFVHPPLFPRKWVSVIPSMDEPYPQDIRDYDAVSLSVDTQ